MSNLINKPIAVMMCVYKNDNDSFIKEAIDSIFSQIGVKSHLYVFVDGLVPSSISDCLNSYLNKECFFIHFSDENIGLASGLNWLLDNCIDLSNYDFIARMDADDISETKRLQTQVSFLCRNSEISVVGSDVMEISEFGEPLFYKKMDKEHNIILSRIIKKCPFNHPTVVFRSSLFKEGFRYKSELKNTQDYYLWVDLLSAGKKFSNINEPLLKFRVNNDFHSRRGVKKAMNDLRSRLYAFKHLNVLNIANVCHTVLLFILRVSPSFIKKLAYKFLR